MIAVPQPRRIVAVKPGTTHSERVVTVEMSNGERMDVVVPVDWFVGELVRLVDDFVQD